jgi:hypothetical protein
MSILRVTLQQVDAVDYFCRFHPDMTGRMLATPHGAAVNSFDPCGRYIAGWITAGTPRCNRGKSPGKTAIRGIPAAPLRS